MPPRFSSRAVAILICITSNCIILLIKGGSGVEGQISPDHCVSNLGREGKFALLSQAHSRAFGQYLAGFGQVLPCHSLSGKGWVGRGGVMGSRVSIHELSRYPCIDIDL